MKVKTNIKSGNRIQESLEQVRDILKIAGETISKPRAVVSEFVNPQDHYKNSKPI
jgi:hypothetical protein